MAYVTSEELQDELENLAEELGISVQELLADYVTGTDYATDKAAIVARLDALDVIDDSDGVETLAEKVAALNAMFTENGDLATDVLNRIATNATAIADETTRATNVEAGLRTDVDAATATGNANTSAISALDTRIVNNKSAAEAADAALGSRIDGVVADVATLNGDDTVDGSVAKAVKDEETRAKAELATEKNNLENEISAGDIATLGSAKDYTDTREAAIRADMEAADAAASTAQNDTNAALSGLQSEVDASQAAIGLNEDGTFAPVDDTNSSEEYVTDVNGDADTLKKAVRKVARKAKAADLALDAKIDAETTARETADADLQNQIDSLTGTGTGSLGELQDRVTVVENDLNDTTVDGNIVKGVKTRVADLESGLTANQADQDAKDAATNARIDALEGSGLAKGVICGRKAANKFREVFGQSPITENCPAADGDNGDGSAL